MWLIKVFIAGFFIILGYFIMPWLLAITPFESRRLRFLDSVYGNRFDGLGYDFQQEESRITMPDTWYNRRWPRYLWFLRNPANNYFRNNGPNGIVQEIRRYGQYITIAKIGGKWWWLFRFKMYYGPTLRYFEIKLGSKLWQDNRTNSRLAVKTQFENSLVFSVQFWRKGI